MSAVIGAPGEQIRFHVTFDKDRGIGGESMWGIVEGVDTVRVANIPFFAEGFTLGDIVQVRDTGPTTIPEFVQVIEERSVGQCAIVFTDEANEETQSGILSILKGLGAKVERGTDRFVVAAFSDAEVGKKGVDFLNSLIGLGLVEDPEDES